MIPKLTKLFINTVWTGAEWATETFVSYCEAMIRAAVRTGLAVLIADLLVRASIRFDSNILLLLGIFIGSGGLFYFAVMSAPARMAAEGLSKLSAIAKQEIERLSNILFLMMVMLFYLGIDQGQQHPHLLKVFLGIMMLLFFVAILPGQSQTIVFFKKRFQLLIMVPVILMMIFSATPEAVANRIINGHSIEQVTGTVPIEISYRINGQEQIIDCATGQLLAFFDQIAAKNSTQPRPLIGWTQEKNGRYLLYRWFDGQKNFNGNGREIKPITPDKLADIITLARNELEIQAAEEQRIKEEQKAAAEAEALKRKAEEKAAVQALADELASQQAEEARQDFPSEHSNEQAQEIVETAEIEPPENEAEQKQYEQEQPIVQLIPVSVTIMPPNNKFSGKDLIVVRPNKQFLYQGKPIFPYHSVITLAITKVAPASEKNKYTITAQPQKLIIDSIVNSRTYDISSQTEPIQFMADKDDSHSWQKILVGTAIGTGIGALADGKKGAAKGAFIGGGAGTVYAIASHGYKFKLTPGDSLPPIMFRP